MADYEEISTDDFASTEGLEAWGVLGWHAYALFQTSDFATGLRLVDEIGRLAEEANHHPDVNLRYGVVAVRTSTHDTDSLTSADVDLARAITEAASRLGVTAAAQRDEVDRSLWQM